MANITDSFDRADNASALGTADVGGTWTSVVGIWGIIGNRAYLVTSFGQNVATLDSSEVDGTLQVTIPVMRAAADLGLVFRFTDNNNYYLAQFGSTGTVLYKSQFGSFTSLATASITGASGDVFSVEFSGTSIVIKQNGVTRIATTDGTYTTQTVVGIRSFFDTDSRFDDFSFVAGGGGGGVTFRRLLVSP